MATIPICSPQLIKLPRPSFSSASPSRFSTRKTRTVVCNASIDRRDMLIGLGGLYSAASSGLIMPGQTIAAPIESPDLSTCKKSTVADPDGNIVTIEPTCCPPYSDKIVDFFPSTPSRIRVRPAVQNMTNDQIAKYKEATKRMRALDKEDPRSFYQQAMVHCAYCNNAYDQVGVIPEQPLQIHNGWLFFPFHRWYLYFYEKILGKLIDDEDFVMPFWNYDDPAGMTLPAIFDDPTSSLYDPIRNQEHRGSTIVDLNFGTPAETTDTELIQLNLDLMYRQMVTNSKTPKQFFGEKYVTGDTPNPGAGSVEGLPHSPIHVWVGSEPSPETPFRENMGNFYSAGRDPIFYCHHMNVDRLWNVWKDISPRNRDPRRPEFLEANFLFYDENAQLVRVKVKDCLNSSLLGYRYDSVPIAWMEKTPTPSFPRGSGKKRGKKLRKPGRVKFPLQLKSTTSVLVKRSIKKRSKAEKETAEEVVVIEGIQLNFGDFVKFDVYVNSPDNAVKPGTSEFSGSFVNVPHNKDSNGKTSLTLGLTDLLDDIEADDDDDIIITLVPRKGLVKIGGVSIKFLTDDD
ncbi:Catechol oxidase [Zostera marina]|uniref:Catechol oxidase n=1 Tax=Zostera marina TaxID=29655 RepID=A0A0K9NTB7_ZOSMR|nr:Catechol oxidase [Zostera marina]